MPSQDLSPLRLTIDRRRAEVADPEFEDRFLRQFLPERKAQLKASLLVSAFFYIAFGVTDLTTLGITPIAWAMVALRVVVGAAALGGYVAVTRHPDSVRVSILTTCLVLAVGLIVFPILCWYQPSAMAWNLMSFALVLMAVYVNFPNRFVYAVAIGVGASVEFAAMLIFQDTLNPDDILALVLMLILGNALGYIAASRFHLAQREQFRSSLLLQQLADRDPLTGCYNRRVLQSGLLDAELARARRYGNALSAVLCDIDHFKRINDSYGHAAGDQVLSGFAGLLQAMTQETDGSVIRYGGEEFLIVLPQAELAEAQALAERIRHAFANTPTPIGGGAFVSATASFGIASIPTLHHFVPAKFEALIEAADVQLYGVKHGGRNGVRGTVVSAAAEPLAARA